MFEKLVIKDLQLDDLLLDNSGDDWIISVKDSDEQITIENGNHWASGRIETIEVDGESMSYRAFENAVSSQARTIDEPAFSLI